MKISKTRKKGCGKRVHLLLNECCGNYSLKHNEYYYCDDCSKEGKEKRVIDNG